MNQAPEPCYFKNQRTRRSYAEATRTARKLHAPLFSIIGLEIFTLDQFEQVWTSLDKFSQVWTRKSYASFTRTARKLHASLFPIIGLELYFDFCDLVFIFQDCLKGKTFFNNISQLSSSTYQPNNSDCRNHKFSRIS